MITSSIILSNATAVALPAAVLILTVSPVFIVLESLFALMKEKTAIEQDVQRYKNYFILIGGITAACITVLTAKATISYVYKTSLVATRILAIKSLSGSLWS